MRKEITKAPTYYFTDLGLRNYAANTFGNATTFSDGFLFENFVYKVLKKNEKLTSTTIHFWRTRDGSEVDFVVNIGQESVPVEVKYSRLKSLEITRSFRSFLSKYNPRVGYIVHLGDSFEATIEKTTVSSLLKTSSLPNAAIWFQHEG